MQCLQCSEQFSLEIRLSALTPSSCGNNASSRATTETPYVLIKWPNRYLHWHYFRDQVIMQIFSLALLLRSSDHTDIFTGIITEIKWPRRYVHYRYHWDQVTTQICSLALSLRSSDHEDMCTSIITEVKWPDSIYTSIIIQIKWPDRYLH